MVHPSENPSALDLSRISFPSDELSIKAFRAAENARDGFDDEKQRHFENLEALIITERDLARKAFEATLQGSKPNRMGRNDLDAAVERREMISGMDSEYQLYGLSTGAKHTVELVRGIEAQAIAQAQAILGKPR